MLAKDLGYAMQKQKSVVAKVFFNYGKTNELKWEGFLTDLPFHLGDLEVNSMEIHSDEIHLFM